MQFYDGKTNQLLDIKNTQFTEYVKAKWDEIHTDTSAFRYKIDSGIKERLVDKYIIQLNPNRKTKRRTPEHIINICQQFDVNKFNFTKVCNEEIMFSFKEEKNEETHTLLVNVSPISQYHTLLCPSIHKSLPQVITKQSLLLAINLMFLAQDTDMRIGFNSLCALASVNHLHYHLLFEKNNLPVEEVKCKLIKGELYCLENYPVLAFCFEVIQNSTKIDEIYKLLEFFLQKSIAHNVLITRRDCTSKDNVCGNTPVRVFIWPRKSSAGAKQLAAFNVAVCELSGWFPVYSTEVFNNIQKDALEMELRKWEVDDFENLCEEVKLLY